MFLAAEVRYLYVVTGNWGQNGSIKLWDEERGGSGLSRLPTS